MVIDMNYCGKVTKRVLVLSFTIILIWISIKLSIFYMPFLIAFILSLFLEPIIKFLMRKLHFKRKTSSIIVFIVAFSIIIGVLIWGITTLISEISNILGNINVFLDNGNKLLKDILNKIDLSKLQLSEQVINTLQESARNTLNTFTTWMQNFLTSAMNFITSIPAIGIYFVITFLSLYFMCVDKVYMLDQFEHHMPKSWVKKIGGHIREIIKILGGYLKAEAILVLISFCISLAGLYILKFIGLNIKFPLVAALGIGFVDALPIFGSGTVMLPWAVVSSINGDFNLGISIFILWIIISITRQIIEPKIISGQIGIHPIFTIISMYTGFRIVGVGGMLIGPIVLIILKNVFATLIDDGVFKSIFER